MTDALRFNQGKPEMSYADMFPAALVGVSRTLMYGTQRMRDPYPKWNWRNGSRYLELYDSARRHMVAWLNREDEDQAAQADGWILHNLDMAIGNLMRLRQQISDQTGTDDRPGSTAPPVEFIPLAPGPYGPFPPSLEPKRCSHDWAPITFDEPLINRCSRCDACIAANPTNSTYVREDGAIHSTWFGASRAKP